MLPSSGPLASLTEVGELDDHDVSDHLPHIHQYPEVHHNPTDLGSFRLDAIHGSPFLSTLQNCFPYDNNRLSMLYSSN